MATQALLIIDMLKDFILPEGKLSIGEAGPTLICRISRELSRARSEGIPVIYVCDRHHPGDKEFDMFPEHSLAGTSGAEIVQELLPEKGEPVIYKRRYSGFFATDLDITLREMGVERLILTGVCTNICLLYTAADARNLGYQVLVIKEGVASFDESAHQFALKELRETLGVTIIEGEVPYS